MAPAAYTLPSLADVSRHLINEGIEVYCWTTDVSWVYRQLWGDPLSAALYCITLDSATYIDMALPFGCRTSGAACIRVTSANTWLMSRRGHHLLVYVDDFIGCEGHYLVAFDALLTLCAEQGVALALDKCVLPAVRLIWLGFELSFKKLTIRIPAPRWMRSWLSVTAGCPGPL